MQRLTSIFLWSAACVFLITGAAKIITVMSEVKLLAHPDPLFHFLSNRQLLFLVAVVELGIAAVVIGRRSLDDMSKLILVAWMATGFLVYRFGLWAIGYKGTCSCLGHLTEVIGLNHATMEWVMRGILTFLLILSYGLLFKTWKEDRVAARQGGASLVVGTESEACPGNLPGTRTD